MNQPTPTLRAISGELRELEQAAAERGRVSDEEMLELFWPVSAARDALSRLAEAVRGLDERE